MSEWVKVPILTIEPADWARAMKDEPPPPEDRADEAEPGRTLYIR